MRKTSIYLVLALFFTMNTTGCSLFSSGDEDQETATVSEESGEATDAASESADEFAADDFEGGDDFDAEEMAKGEGEEELTELASEDVEVEDTFGDEYPDDDYGVEGATAAAVPDAPSDDDFAQDYIDDNSFAADDSEEPVVDDSLFVDEGGLPGDTMVANEDTDLFGGEEMEPVVDTPTYADSSFDSGSSYDSGFGGVTDVNQGLVPVKKMKPAAYKRAGANINRLYVVRPGENMDSIAEKLYGDSAKADALYSYNSHFQGKTLKVGDKIYYESPNNANDQSMMTYYEDNNIAPQYYTSQDGDSIRKVAKQLLGDDRSWMEVYATNDSVESKGKIPGGLQIRYWPEGAEQTIAMNDTPPPAMEAEPEPMPEPPPAPPVEEPEEVAMDEPVGVEGGSDEGTDLAQLDEPDFDDDEEELGAAAGTTAPPKPIAPPPPPAPVAKPNFNKPAPPKVAGADDALDDPFAAFGDDQTIMGALGVLLILAAIIMMIFIRRSRAKRVNFSQTQV